MDAVGSNPSVNPGDEACPSITDIVSDVVFELLLSLTCVTLMAILVTDSGRKPPLLELAVVPTVEASRRETASSTSASGRLIHMVAPLRGSGTSDPKPQRPGNSGRVRRRHRRNDPFRQHRAVLGDDARISWWMRVRALLFLFLMVVILGAAVAGFVGLLIFAGTLIIEILAA